MYACAHASVPQMQQNIQTNKNIVRDFRDFVCSLFPKAILFTFITVLLVVLLCKIINVLAPDYMSERTEYSLRNVADISVLSRRPENYSRSFSLFC